METEKEILSELKRITEKLNRILSSIQEMNKESKKITKLNIGSAGDYSDEQESEK